jgi:hypothetical protein
MVVNFFGSFWSFEDRCALAEFAGSRRVDAVGSRGINGLILDGSRGCGRLVLEVSGGNEFGMRC